MNMLGFIRGMKAVTPSDTAEVAPGIGLWIGNGGTVTVTCEDGTSETLENVPNGYPLPGRFTAIKATGTTATSIVALY